MWPSAPQIKHADVIALKVRYVALANCSIRSKGLKLTHLMALSGLAKLGSRNSMCFLPKATFIV
jgi:hypothetical protein